jgi:hypothetical protein
VFTFEDYFLGATGEKVSNPRQSFTSHSRVVEFQEKTLIEADATKLQEDIDALQNWESTWQMSFNPDKCEVLRIANKRNKIMANYYIHDQQLQTILMGLYRRQSSANSLALDQTQGGMSFM